MHPDLFFEDVKISERLQLSIFDYVFTQAAEMR